MTGRPGRTGRGAGQGSAGELLELVRSRRAVTRGALQQATGLSRATVGQRLDRLFRAGWLREGAGGPVDSPLGGRPSIPWSSTTSTRWSWPPTSTRGTRGRPCCR
jgi:predicted ArsR family transcriptional regulator